MTRLDRRRLAGALALATLACAPASAQTLDCRNPANQMSMNVCAGRDFKLSDRALNETYRALAAKVTPPGRAKLQAAQRAWLAWRDAQCAFDNAGHADGSIYPYTMSVCLDGLTRAQTRHLAGQLHCQEGDLSCGGQ